MLKKFIDALNVGRKSRLGGGRTRLRFSEKAYSERGGTPCTPCRHAPALMLKGGGDAFFKDVRLSIRREEGRFPMVREENISRLISHRKGEGPSSATCSKAVPQGEE